jgi:glycine/D-amino acid oxidase-like deaminating enzyme
MPNDQKNAAPLPALTRRDLLRAGSVAMVGTAFARKAAALGKTRVAVVGAGAFGGWTALWLRRRGAEVTLFDPWGPGHSRSSSGGETRVIRGMYGADRIYTEWVVRSFALWRESAAAWRADLYHPTGALWLFRGDDAYARAAMPVMASLGLKVQSPDLATAAKRWPQIDFGGIAHVHYEPEAGYLTARVACRQVAEALIREGGAYRQAEARPGEIEGGRMRSLLLDDGSRPEFDAVVFACGPWLGSLFPEFAAPHLAPTRQEVYYFGTPARDRRFDEGSMPVWIEFAERIFYGVPGNEHRGFKIADDSHGERVEPTTLERTPSLDGLARARAHVAQRFPALAKAPLVESRVCQYTNTADSHFLIDRHPGASNVWLLGGGSGHGYKLGPALGENVSGWVLGDGTPPARFRLGNRGATDTGGESQLRTGGGQG